MKGDQEITYTNRSYGIVTGLSLVCVDVEINYGNLMHHVHEIEKLVGFCGTFSLKMVSHDMEEA